MKACFLLPLLICALAGVFALLPSSASAQEVDVAEMHTLVQRYTDLGWFSGAVLVAKDGEVLLQEGYGMAHYELDVPNTADHVFRIVGLTNTFTAAAILKLAEQGKLTLDDPVTKHLPDWPASGNAITIHHLLTMQAGIQDVTRIPEFVRNISRASEHVDSLVAWFKDEPMVSEPGAQWRLSNSSYHTLAAIIAHASGEGYEGYLQKHLFEPAGLMQTQHDDPKRFIRHRAAGYSKGDPPTNAGWFHMSNALGMADLSSTVGDINRWVEALQTPGVILSQASLDAMFSVQVEIAAGRGNMGYGWMLPPQPSPRTMYMHPGLSINGFSSALNVYPDDDLTIVVLSNFFASSASRIGASLANIVFDEPYQLPRRYTVASVAPSTLQKLVGEYETGGITVTIQAEADHLIALLNGRVRTVLLPSSDSTFFSRTADRQVDFTFDEDGTVSRMFFTMQGNRMEGKPVVADAEPQLIAQNPARFATTNWTTLATDEAGDGQSASLADGKTLAYYYDAATDSLWFRLDLHSLPTTEALGLNIVVDTDQDASTGSNWWGSNRHFTFDRLLTIWVRADGDGYRGTVGIGSAAGAGRRSFTDLMTDNLAFSIDTDQPAFIVGVKRSDLDDDGKMRVLAAVGSNQAWNDDIGDPDTPELTLPIR